MAVYEVKLCTGSVVLRTRNLHRAIYKAQSVKVWHKQVSIRQVA